MEAREGRGRRVAVPGLELGEDNNGTFIYSGAWAPW